MAVHNRDASDRTLSVASRATTTGGASEEPARSLLVLLVEHHPGIRSLLTTYLLSRGAMAMPAAGAAHAEVVCKALAPELVLIDLPLPDTDGPALVRWIKTRRPGVSIAVCMRPDPECAARCRGEGADEIVDRPLELVHLDWALGRLAAERTS
jgi:DNA-binding response OmpR family regulator